MQSPHEQTPKGSTRALLAFFVLTFALSWWPWPLVLLNPDSVALLPWSPLAAAFVMAAVVGGRRGLKDLLRRTVRWRVGLRWYAVAFLLPAAVAGLAAALNLLLGADAPTAADFRDWYLLPLLFVVTLVVKGPLTEEVAWRGFALPGLLARLSPFAASVLLGGIWALWHLPLLVSDPSRQRPPLQFALVVVALSVLLTWLYRRTDGSVLLAALMHAAINTAAAFVFPAFGEAEYGRLWWLYAGVLWAVALAVVAFGGLAAVAPKRAPAPPARGRGRPLELELEEAPMRRRTVPSLVLVLLVALLLAPAAAVAQPGTPAAGQDASLVGVAPLPLTGDRLAAFEAYVAEILAAAEVPGAAVAVVQGGQVAYAQGFGVKELGTDAPVTADTLMQVGSTQKSMTSLLAASLVDAGRLRWDTKLVDLLPGFATADPALTERLTVADAFCACSGLPRRDLELMFNGAEVTAERLVSSVAGIAPVAPFGQAFQYSNQLYAVGGYAAAAAAGGPTDDLYAAYVAAMRERVLGPLGMTRATFAFDEVVAGNDYATPHARDLSGTYRPLPLAVEEGFVTPVAPAGGLWASAREMARYLQTEIGRGITPDGTRVVSAENLEVRWKTRVTSPPEDFPTPMMAHAYAGYGLGWGVGDYLGQPMLSHTGETLGSAAQVAVWPEAGLGVAVLTNGRGADRVAQAVQFRLAELLFGQPAEFDPLVRQAMAGTAEQMAAMRARLGDRVDSVPVTPFLGRYRNPDLGEVALELRDGALILDVGEFRAELRPLLDEAGNVGAYVASEPPITGWVVGLRPGAGGEPELVIPQPGTDEEYVFEVAPATPPGTPAS